MLVVLLGAAVLGGCGEEGGAAGATAGQTAVATTPVAIPVAGPRRPPMPPGQIEARFRARLAEAGVNTRHPTAADVQRAWEAMYLFAAEEPVRGTIDEEGDALLAQYGAYSWDGPETFEIDLTRQVILGEAGDDDIFQLSCTFTFAMTDRLRDIEIDNAWSMDFPSLEAFYPKAMQMPGFVAVRESGADPLGFESSYGGAG